MVSLDKSACVVTRGREPVGLTCLEFDLLEYLLRSAGKVVSRALAVLTAFEVSEEWVVCMWDLP